MKFIQLHLPLLIAAVGIVAWSYSTFATIYHVESKFEAVMHRLGSIDQTQQRIWDRLEKLRDLIENNRQHR